MSLKPRALMLKANWIHTEDVEKWLQQITIGKTLNVCCGMSLVGDTRVDIDPSSNRTVDGDLFKLPYASRSFDTVICDPPFGYYQRFRWILKLANIADKRLLLSSPAMSIRLSRKNWSRELYYASGNATRDHPRGTLFLRLYWCFDRLNHKLPQETI